MKFRIRINELQDGDWSLIIKQTFFSLPFYYYIAFSADEPFLWWKGFFFEILEDGQISFLNLFIPLIFPLFISYWIIYSDLNKTDGRFFVEYDMNTIEYLDKRVAVPRMTKTFALWYYVFGIMGAMIFDFVLFSLRFLSFFF